MEFYDRLETQDPEEREADISESLPVQIAQAKKNSTAYARLLNGVSPDTVRRRADLTHLPLTRKSDLADQQQSDPPFGGFNSTPLAKLARVFQSPGPLYEPEARRSDYWRFGRALHAANIRTGDLIHNTFSYHFTPAGFMVQSGAAALGCPVFPAGSGQTELQVTAIRDLKPVAYTGTPSFLKIIMDKAAAMGVGKLSLKKALVSGEALPASLRQQFAEQGISVRQCYATADLGLIAYESDAMEGLIADESVLVEIVRPGTGDLVPEGEVGEVVVTTFNPDYPLIRFATGDLSAILPGKSPCGRTNTRLRGWMGRADQTTKVRGMFVYPSQVATVVSRHPEVKRARLVVDSHDHSDTMVLLCEVDNPLDNLQQAIADSVRDVCKLRADVVFKNSGELPNDGKVIDDIRSYE